MPGLGGYCHFEFWNSSVVWEAEDPDLSPCFERTVLVWVPCLLLWLLAPLETRLLWRSGDRLIPWTVLNVSKCLFAAVLLAVQLAGLIFTVKQHYGGESVRPVDVFTPVILFATIALALVLMLFGKRRGARTSGVLWTFWTLLLFCAVPEFRTRLRAATGQVSVDQAVTPFVLYMIYFPVLFGEWFLNCFADAPPQFVRDEVKSDNQSPESGSSFISRLVFAWFEPMAFHGWRRPLQRGDLWELSAGDRCSHVVPTFNHHWHAQLQGRRM